MKTSIEWTDESVNPIRARNLETGAVGHFCEKISPGCAHCYASRWNTRVRPSGAHLIGTGLPFIPVNRSKVDVFLDEKVLQYVLRKRKPTKFFWCDMTDIAGEWVRDSWFAAMLGVMAFTSHHTHQILTKRIDLLYDKFWAVEVEARKQGFEGHVAEFCAFVASKHFGLDVRGENAPLHDPWPLPNVWVGTSVENQRFADLRAPRLAALALQGWFTWVSGEPLLAEVNWSEYLAFIRWLVVGLESGPGARPGDVAWVRSAVRQCQAAGVPPFVKQLGAVPMMTEAAWRAEPRTRMLKARNHRRVPPDCVPLQLYDRKGGNPLYWPEGLPREFPEVRSCQ